MHQFLFSQCSAIQLAAMKSKALKEKFKSKLRFEFVKPLYKKVRNKNSFSATTANLVGNGICVKRDIVAEDIVVKSVLFQNDNRKSFTLPGQSACERKTVKSGSYNEKRAMSVLDVLDRDKSGYVEQTRNIDKMMQLSNTDTVHKGTSWLRWRPAPRGSEPWRAWLARALLSQLGLIVELAVGTAVFTLLVHWAEAPYERQVTDEFKKMQRRLVIELATELRQVG
ncbi:hypothetical protein JYU34_010480 [Plutella xylostella]|uniref:EF-hand domain-containing protein n=1 Tax=Plutella xylostella TaxID=51655 RepID=A0ABQ7QM77_PLUXY|nr:hypothetical protein JYU34_010480 [Plutella xylostella]